MAVYLHYAQRHALIRPVGVLSLARTWNQTFGRSWGLKLKNRTLSIPFPQFWFCGPGPGPSIGLPQSEQQVKLFTSERCELNPKGKAKVCISIPTTSFGAIRVFSFRECIVSGSGRELSEVGPAQVALH